jgi:hypothetical protein
MRRVRQRWPPRATGLRSPCGVILQDRSDKGNPYLLTLVCDDNEVGRAVAKAVPQSSVAIRACLRGPRAPSFAPMTTVAPS